MIHVASRMTRVQPAASMVVSQAAKKLVAQGIDVSDLGLGEPDFATPTHIIEAAHAAARAGDTLYTANSGTPGLRQAIAGKFARENGIDFSLDELIVANGAKQIIFNALMATLDPGDEVVIPVPYFVSYPEMVKLLGGEPVLAYGDPSSGFRLTPERLEKAITSRTRWLFLNSPNNPAGYVFSDAELKSLGEVLERHPQVMILSDEIYEHIVFGCRFVSFGQACPQLRERSLIVNGVSKSYAMTGWRIGYAGGPSTLIKAMANVQSQSCTSICSISQAAAVAALNGPQEEVARFRDAFWRRRDIVLAGVTDVSGLTIESPEGAFYAYIGCAALIGARTPTGETLDTDTAVANYFLHEGGVAAVPGVAYGLSPYFRISTAAADHILEAAIGRIKRAVQKLETAA